MLVQPNISNVHQANALAETTISNREVENLPNPNPNNNVDNENQNNNNAENEEEEENEEDLEVVSVLMTKILKTHFNFQIFFLFLLSYILWELPLYIIFSISWLNDLLNLLFYLQKLLKTKAYCLKTKSELKFL
jgi:hypothetical protein